MAKMIPPTPHAGTKSNGELRVFQRLRDDPETSEWIVLHSYDLPRHVARVMGEIDFLVLIPNIGALCLSVKDCASLCRDGSGVWHLGSLKPCAEGPFKKAREDMFSLRRRVADEFAVFKNVPFGFAVLFTRVTPSGSLRHNPCEWEEHEQIFAEAFNHQPIGKLLANSLDRTVARLELAGLVTRLASFNIEAVGRLASSLRPDFECYQPPKHRAAETECELKRYTEEQMDALDAAEMNARVLYQGPAGTGKTLLAIEAARREAALGRRVLMLCFNALLKEWIEEQARPLTAVAVRTLHGHMHHVARCAFRQNTDSDYYERELPALAIEVMLRGEDEGISFDTLIVDEAQDVMKACYFDVLDLSLRGGMAGGRWLIFGDFERQNIYGTDATDPVGYCLQRGSPAYQHPLRRNCRNTPRVAKYAEMLGGLSPGYSGVRRPDDGLSPSLRFYATPERQRDELVATLEELERQRFLPGEIVVLSPKNDQACCAANIRVSPWWERLKPYAAGGGFRYCTIHRFKGLEAPCVVVTDIDELGVEERSSLLYIAITRATNRVAILAHEKVKAEIGRILLSRGIA